MKKIILFFIACLLPCFFLTAEAKTKKKYLALGDSITYGYSLDNPKEECYPSLFAKSNNLELTNEAVSGDKSSDLLNRLSKYDVTEYDIISVCIGANDIMSLIEDKLALLIDSKSYAETMSDLVNLENDLEFNSKIDNALENLDNNLTTICNILKSSDAMLFILNVYNPYKKIELLNFSQITDHYINKLNEVIAKHKDGFTFIDLNKEFAESDEILTNKNLDPHPTKEGQKVIANLLISEYGRNSYSVVCAIVILIFGTFLLAFEIIYVKKIYKKIKKEDAKEVKKEAEKEESKNSEAKTEWER